MVHIADNIGSREGTCGNGEGEKYEAFANGRHFERRKSGDVGVDGEIPTI